MAESILQAVLLPSLILLVATVFILRYLFGWQWQHPYKLPPGPPGLPLFGHLISLGRAANLLRDSEERYGPIFTMWLGSVPSIVISGADATREALLERGSALASRPHPRSRGILTANYRIMNTSAYGPYWRSLRRGLVGEVLSPSRLKEIRPARKSIIDSHISWLKQQAGENAGVVPVSTSCRLTIFKILAFMCVGRHLEDKLLGELDETAKLTLILQGWLRGDFIPIMRLFERKQIKVRQTYRDRQERLFGPLIDEHRELRKDGNPRPGTYIDTLLNKENEEGEKLKNNEIAALCTEFMNAGTDTTAACVEWAMANLVVHQDIQERVYQEISQVAGKRPLTEDDIGNLPYLRAVIKETLRRHPSAHFTFTHAATHPCKVFGYDIPTNAIVSFHLTPILRDPKVWEDPMEFKPERFLNTEIDITGWKKSTAIPFGAGRRICPGAGLALLHANLIVGRLVQSLQWATRKPGEEVDMAERSGGVVGMKTPLFASIKERGIEPVDPCY